MKLLTDGNSLAARCWWAKVNDLVTSDGKPAGVVYGVLKGQFWIMDEAKVIPEDSIVVWDSGRAEGRKKLLHQYKTQRGRPQWAQTEQRDFATCASQIALCLEALEYLGIRQIKVDGCEADDLISILACLFQAQGSQVLIYSNDKDFHQLATENCFVHHPGKGRITTAQILEEWDVSSPTQIPFVRAIVGDKSDNIPGVPYLGRKKAANVVRYWNTPRNELKGVILKHLDLVQGEMWGIVERNLKLMKLPKSWGDTFYTAEQGADFLEQLRKPVVPETLKFAKFCKTWELESIVESIRW